MIGKPSGGGGGKNPFASGGGNKEAPKKNPFARPAGLSNMGGTEGAGGKSGKGLSNLSGGTGVGKNPFKRGQHERAAAVLATSSGQEVMGHGSSKDTFGKRLAASRLKPGEELPEEATGENYQKRYLKQKADDQAAAEKKRREDAERNRKEAERVKLEQQKLLEEQKANNFRARAKDLQGQIASLKQQLGQNPDANQRINGNISALQNELNGIPAIYW